MRTMPNAPTSGDAYAAICDRPWNVEPAIIFSFMPIGFLGVSIPPSSGGITRDTSFW
jgi:hypothetical protein